MTETGTLVVVATPIGNLEDLSPRGRRELTEATVIVCEDTRRTGKLLELTGIGHRPLLMVNDHNEFERKAQVVERLHNGERVAVVTDAGMPGISDPGQRLVAAAVEAGHRVEVIPGPTAAISALVGSGLPTARFCFEGFLPRKGSARKERLAQLALEQRTMVLFESPRRTAATLADLAEAFGADRPVAVARELTKLYEQYWRGSLADGAAWADSQELKGEVVLVVQGAPEAEAPTEEQIDEALRSALDAGVSKRDAAALVAAELGLAKNKLYQRVLGM